MRETQIWFDVFALLVSQKVRKCDVISEQYLQLETKDFDNEVKVENEELQTANASFPNLLSQNS